MGKNDFLTPKAIGNRIKAKGLQKLRWFCQMCQKQCRDENGFKCHLTSESHLRQMAIFGEDPARMIDGFSAQFEAHFLEHMRCSHRHSRVSANEVYNQFITDRYHVHMNSTRWLTLTEFITHLGREGKLTVEETPRGLFIRYVDRDDGRRLREEARAKRMRVEQGEEDRRMKRYMQMQKDAGDQGAAPAAGGAIERGADGQEVKFSFGKQPAEAARGGEDRARPGAAPAALFDERREGSAAAAAGGGVGGAAAAAAGGRKSALESIMEEQERAREREQRRDYWLREGIVVKILDKKLQARGLYKMKGAVVRVVDRYVAEVEVAQGDGGVLVRVDQSKLETVIPKIDGRVRIVNGAYRGCAGRLVGIRESEFKGVVLVADGAYKGKTAVLEYEDFSKAA